MPMSDEKIHEVLNLYEAKAREILANRDSFGDRYAASHKCMDMIPKVREFLREGKREKLMRWLGFMQGAWWTAGVYSVDELKAHNMPDGEKFEPAKPNPHLDRMLSAVTPGPFNTRRVTDEERWAAEEALGDRDLDEGT